MTALSPSMNAVDATVREFRDGLSLALGGRMSFRASAFLLACAAFAFSAEARAADACDIRNIGTRCATAGANHDQAGICEPVSCGDGGSGDGGAGCFACLVDGAGGGCGATKSNQSQMESSFRPVTGGCCSIVGAAPLGMGGAIVGVGVFVAAARRRRRK